MKDQVYFRKPFDAPVRENHLYYHNTTGEVVRIDDDPPPRKIWVRWPNGRTLAVNESRLAMKPRPGMLVTR